MVKGRRAADRRRERQGKGPIDDGRGHTLPGVDPLPSEEEDDDLDEAGEHGGERARDAGLPLMSDVRDVRDARDVEQTRARSALSSPGAGSTGTAPQRRASSLRHEVENDPEASFVKAVRQTRDDRRSAGSAGEVTAVKPLPDKPKKRGGHLIVLEGPDAGGETDIEVSPSLVGRTATADIGLSDPSISRRHLELTLTDDGWVLLDLGSLSGTLVNGVLVTGDAPLRHGDVISLGKTEMRFLAAAALPKPRPEPVVPDAGDALQQPIEPTEQLTRRDKTMTRATAVTGMRTGGRVATADPGAVRARVRKTTTWIIAACAAVLVALVVGRAAYRGFIDDKAPAQIRAQVAELLAEGKRRLQAQDVDGAKATAETVLALDEKNADAESLLRMAHTEAASRDAIALALRLGDEERDVEAGQILKRVPDASVFAPTRDRLRRTLDERGMIRSRRVIESLLDEGRIDDALAAAQRHAGAWPGDQVGQALLERAAAAKESTPRNPVLSAAQAALRDGDLARARQIAGEGRLAGFLRDLDELEASLARGKASLRRFDEDAAVSLDNAFHLLGELGATASSPIFAEVRKPYADALYLSGTARLEKDPCGGARELFKAGRVMADDPKIQQKLRELEDRAMAGLERARAARQEDAERAAALAREHLCLARIGTRTYDELKALSRL